MKLSATAKEAVADAEAEISQEEVPQACAAPPGPRTPKTAVLNSLTSASGQRTYDHAIREFVAWYVRSPASDTIAGVQALALRVIAERLENREVPAELLNVTSRRRE